MECGGSFCADTNKACVGVQPQSNISGCDRAKKWTFKATTGPHGAWFDKFELNEWKNESVVHYHFVMMPRPKFQLCIAGPPGVVSALYTYSRPAEMKPTAKPESIIPQADCESVFVLPYWHGHSKTCALTLQSSLSWLALSNNPPSNILNIIQT